MASSKHAGEGALRARQEELAAHGVRLLIVTGDLIEGTITQKLLARAAAQGFAAATPSALPTATEMGAAIAATATDPTRPSRAGTPRSWVGHSTRWTTERVPNEGTLISL